MNPKLVSAVTIIVGSIFLIASILIKGNEQHLGNIGTTTVTSCGTTPSITGGNSYGTVVIGTGVVTACTVTFSHALSVTPRCIVSGSLTTAVLGVVESTTGVVVNSSISIPGARFNYFCFNPASTF